MGIRTCTLGDAITHQDSKDDRWVKKGRKMKILYERNETKRNELKRNDIKLQGIHFSTEIFSFSKMKLLTLI